MFGVGSIGTAYPNFDISTLVTSNSCCGTETYTIISTTNATYTGTLPNIVVTPTDTVWSIVYEACCDDGTTCDSGTLEGTACEQYITALQNNITVLDEVCVGDFHAPININDYIDFGCGCEPLTYSVILRNNAVTSQSGSILNVKPINCDSQWQVRVRVLCPNNTNIVLRFFGNSLPCEIISQDQDFDPLYGIGTVGSPYPNFDVSTVFTGVTCCPINNYTIISTTNATYTGTLPNIVVTPTDDEWEIQVEACCAASDTCAISILSGKTCVPNLDWVGNNGWDDWIQYNLIYGLGCAGVAYPPFDLTSILDLNCGCTSPTFQITLEGDASASLSGNMLTITPSQCDDGWQVRVEACCGSPNGSTCDELRIYGNTDCCPEILAAGETNGGDIITLPPSPNVGDVLNFDVSLSFTANTCCDSVSYSVSSIQGGTANIVGNNLSVTVDDSQASLSAINDNIGNTTSGDTYDVNPLIVYDIGNLQLSVQGCCNHSSVCATSPLCEITQSNAVGIAGNCSSYSYAIVSQTNVSATINSSGIITFNGFTDCNWQLEYEVTCTTNGVSDIGIISGDADWISISNTAWSGIVGNTTTIDLSTLTTVNDSQCLPITYSATPIFGGVTTSISGNILTLTANSSGNYFISIQACCDCGECDNATINGVIF